MLTNFECFSIFTTIFRQVTLNAMQSVPDTPTHYPDFYNELTDMKYCQDLSEILSKLLVGKSLSTVRFGEL